MSCESFSALLSVFVPSRFPEDDNLFGDSETFKNRKWTSEIERTWHICNFVVNEKFVSLAGEEGRSFVVVRSLDLQLEIAGSISAGPLLTVTLGKLLTHISSVIKQYNSEQD